MSIFDSQSFKIPEFPKSNEAPQFNQVSHFAEISIGSGEGTVIYGNKEGLKFGSRLFDSANAWIKTDGTYKFKDGSGNIILDITGIQVGALASIPSIQGWTSTLVFSATDADTVAWATGVITLTNGTAYSITGANTGNMTAITYIYLDTAVSLTALQTTTTSATAVGANKILIAVAQNNAGSEATFQVFGGSGGLLLKAENIAANTITANEIAANTITASQIASDIISAGKIVTGLLTADNIQTGTLTGRTIIARDVDTGLNIKMDSTDGKLKFYRLGTSYGSIYIDTSSNMIYSSNNTHFFFTDGGSYIGKLFRTDASTHGLELQAGGRVQFTSGRQLRDISSGIACDGDFVPTTDEGYSLGYSNRKWDNVYAQTLWQQTNTDGSRMVYDFGYIEMGLVSPSLIKKYSKKNKNLQNTNGYINGLNLPFNQGTVLSWSSKGLNESKNINDFAIAIASDKGLPIVLGAEPVRIIGKANIGDYIIPSNKKGCAKAVLDKPTQNIIGRCLKNKKSTKEELVLVMIKF